MNDTDESIKSLISNSNDILKNNVIKAINPIRIGKDKGNPINNNPVLAVSKHYVYVIVVIYFTGVNMKIMQEMDMVFVK